MHTQTKFRLLVVRLGAMGDILHALPAVTALRLAHPGWVIDWVVEPRWRALLAAGGPAEGQLNPARPIVDRLHLAASKDWRRAPFSSQTLHEIRSLRQALKQGDYDTVIDFQGAIRSAVVGRLAGCQRLIGEARPRERAASWLYTERVETEGAHVIEQDVELACDIAGDELEPVQPWLPVDPAAELWADSIFSQSSASKNILINPGAGWGAKRWPVERYAAVARHFAEAGFRILINVGPGEEELSRTICQEAGSAALPLQCSLAQLIAATRRVSLAIAGDTGPLHLACALGRPVVGIYGPTDPVRNGPWGSSFRVLRSPESRRDHTRYEAPEAGLLTIQPDAVVRAAEELLYSDKVSI